MSDWIKFVQQNTSVALCTGHREGWKHEGLLVHLETRPSGCVRRGVCQKCGQVFISFKEEKKA